MRLGSPACSSWQACTVSTTAVVNKFKKPARKTGKVFDKNLGEVISKDKDHMCTRYTGPLRQKNATHPRTCDYYGGCDDCADWAASEGYDYWCCYGTECCAYASGTGECSDNPACPANDC